jgi:hypothetical protein
LATVSTGTSTSTTTSTLTGTTSTLGATLFAQELMVVEERPLREAIGAMEYDPLMIGG